MKIRKRITLFFTSILGAILITVSLVIYLLSATNRSTLFVNQLRERVDISENFFLERDNVSPEVEQTIRSKFLNTLPEEVEFYAKLNELTSSIPDTLKNELPDELTLQLSLAEEVTWNKGKTQGMARVYEINNEEYAVIVMAKDTYGWNYLDQLKVVLIFTVILAILVVFISSRYFSRQMLKPIAEKIKKADRIGANNLELRLTVYNENDELGMLAITFNKLLDRLESAFESQKSFVRYASHELKNPLAAIIGETEVSLLKERTKNENIDTIRKVNEIASQMNTLVYHFLELSKLDHSILKRESVLLDEVLISIISDLSYSDYNESIVNFHIGSEVSQAALQIEADPILIRNAFYNIIENAVKFSPQGTPVGVNVFSYKEGIIVEVSDNGIGMSASSLTHLFEPLFRGDNTHSIKGTGLGLSLVKRIFDLHGFSIRVESQLNNGSTFTISIPKS